MNSSTDVGYPIDIVIQKKDEYKIIEHRFEYDDLQKYSKLWQKKISNGIKALPEDWVNTVFSKLKD